MMIVGLLPVRKRKGGEKEKRRIAETLKNR